MYQRELQQWAAAASQASNFKVPTFEKGKKCSDAYPRRARQHHCWWPHPKQCCMPSGGGQVGCRNFYSFPRNMELGSWMTRLLPAWLTPPAELSTFVPAFENIDNMSCTFVTPVRSRATTTSVCACDVMRKLACSDRVIGARPFRRALHIAATATRPCVSR